MASSLYEFGSYWFHITTHDITRVQGIYLMRLILFQNLFSQQSIPIVNLKLSLCEFIEDSK